LAEHGSSNAAAIIEPTGSNYGQVPVAPEFVNALRRATDAHGIVLIFDEVVTGFRVARGGAQATLGIKPDLTTLTKILAGGLPGGAVVGRRDLMELLDPERAATRRIEKIGRQEPTMLTRFPPRPVLRRWRSCVTPTRSSVPTPMPPDCATARARCWWRKACRGVHTAPSRGCTSS